MSSSLSGSPSEVYRLPSGVTVVLADLADRRPPHWRGIVIASAESVSPLRVPRYPVGGYPVGGYDIVVSDEEISQSTRIDVSGLRHNDALLTGRAAHILETVYDIGPNQARSMAATIAADYYGVLEREPPA